MILQKWSNEYFYSNGVTLVYIQQCGGWRGGWCLTPPQNDTPYWSLDACMNLSPYPCLCGACGGHLVPPPPREPKLLYKQDPSLSFVLKTEFDDTGSFLARVQYWSEIDWMEINTLRRFRSYIFSGFWCHLEGSCFTLGKPLGCWSFSSDKSQIRIIDNIICNSIRLCLWISIFSGERSWFIN